MTKGYHVKIVITTDRDCGTVEWINLMNSERTDEQAIYLAQVFCDASNPIFKNAIGVLD